MNCTSKTSLFGIIFFLSFLLQAFSITHAQDITGYWKTTIGKPGNTCDIYYHLEITSDTLRAKVTFPLFGSALYIDFPAGNAKVQENSVTLPFFNGKIESANQLKGLIDVFGVKDSALINRVEHLPLVDTDNSSVKDIRPVWTLATMGEIWSSPVVAGDNILIGSDDGFLHCISINKGTEVWKFKTNGWIRCKPLISNNNIFFVSDDGNLYCLGAIKGDLKWKYLIQSPSFKRSMPSMEVMSTWDYMQSAPLIHEGKIYVGSADSSIYSLDAAKGKLIWKFRTQGIIRSNPTFSGEKIFAGSWDGKVYALDAAKGSIIWVFNTNAQIQSSPFIYKDQVIIGSRSAMVYGLDINSGKPVWNYNYWGSWVESTAVFGENRIIVGSSDLRMVVALNPETGTNLWHTRVAGYSWSIPVTDNKNVFIGTTQNNKEIDKRGFLYCLNVNDGKVVSRIGSAVSNDKVLNGFYASPLITDKYVIAGSIDGKVYCYPKSEFIR